MSSINDVIAALETVLADPKKYSLNSEQVNRFQEAVKLLKSKKKGLTEYLLDSKTVMEIFRMVFEFLNLN